MAEIIQFVPRPNPERPTLLETAETKAVAFLAHAPALLIGQNFGWHEPGTADLNEVPRAEE